MYHLANRNPENFTASIFNNLSSTTMQNGRQQKVAPLQECGQVSVSPRVSVIQSKSNLAAHTDTNNYNNQT